MNASALTAFVLALALAFGALQTWRDARVWRVPRILLQLTCAVLLYACLFPPTTREAFVSGELVVLTPGATPAQLAGSHAFAEVVALPGVDAARTIERVPDLATALRRHADARRLRIVGGGLPLRDREAAQALVSAFDASPLPLGVVELDAPRVGHAGHAWPVAGRIEGGAAARVELRDPSGAVVANANADADGRFALEAQAKGEGSAMFSLRVQDAAGKRLDDIELPIVVQTGTPLSLLLLSGAPDAELKYLRRWAADAGIDVDSRVMLSEGIALTEGHAALDAQALHKADVAIIDERAWAALGASERTALLAAVDEGLGVLLRASGPLPPATMSDWSALGFRTQPATPETSTNVTLDRALGLSGSGLVLTRRALAIDATDAAPMLRADDGSPLAVWRARGQGRIGLWWLADAFRIGLAGHRERYASLWSDTLSTLARAHADASPQIPREARVDERMIVCGINAGDRIEDTHARSIGLLPNDATETTHACAAYWPSEAGWHTLVSGEQRWPFHARSTDATPALVAAQTRTATQALITDATQAGAAATRAIALPRWPLFLAWLLALAVLWVLERRAARVT
jgi:hypothetical protein